MDMHDSFGSGLSAEELELLAAMLEEEGIEVAGDQGIPRRSGRDEPLLSFAQERLWFFDQWEPGSPVYNIPQAIHIRGRLDAAALERALNALVDRHEVLRTTFADHNGQPRQVIAPGLALPLPLVDMAGLAPEERPAAIDRLASAEGQRPFDLARGPLIRACLVRFDPEEHVFLLTIHHIVFDGWSIGVMFRELTALYPAMAAPGAGRAALPPLPIQYADFAIWQRQWLQGQRLEEQIGYWRQRLRGMATDLELPIDRPRPGVQTFNGAQHPIALPEPLVAALRELGQREGATLFMTLLAGFGALLLRYTGQSDLAIGSPIANRTRAETEGLIGYFANTLVLRLDLGGNPPFRTLLGRVRETALGAYANQDVPFEKIVEAVQPNRNLSRNALFQVMFALQALLPPLEAPGLTFRHLEVDSKIAAFELSIILEETRDGVVGVLEYNTDLFEPETISRFARHYATVLEAIVDQPGLPVLDLPLVQPAERRLLLEEWNATAAEHPPTLLLHELVEAQARRAPDAAALAWGDCALSYRELDERAGALAAHLRGLGVGPDVPVGICAERSPEMAVGLLAILKAGGGYVPLDPAYPAHRLAHMLQDAAIPVLLTQERLLGRLPATAARIVLLDGPPPPAAQAPAPPALRPEHMAYMIYTSGSTGEPKGVLVPHRAVANHCQAISAQYGLRPGDRVLQFASISFDVAAEEIFPCWTSGATLVLRSDDAAASPADFMSFARRQELTVVNLPVPFWHEWVGELDRSRTALPPALRLVVVGSDQPSPERWERWRQFVGDQPRWCNAYGPTEATITATVYDPGPLQHPEGPRPAANTVPIGRPIANAQIYLLDRHLQPAPVGLPGEIYIGGDGLARGYHGRPRMTAERFIPNPFAAEPGARLYRTGDLARYRPDGNIEFLGRVDQQIKLRGFRIELGEIEAVIAQHPGVREVVVVVREDAPGDKRLVAYLVANLAIDRVPLRSPCMVIPAAAPPLALKAEDLSERGICVAGATGRLSPGDSVRVRLELPGDMFLDLGGRVQWRDERRAGIQFAPGQSGQAQLRQAVQALIASEHQAVYDQRGRARVPLRRSCLVQTDRGEERELPAVALSARGVRLADAPERWLTGLGVRVRLKLPGADEPTWFAGAIAWRRDGLAGVTFALAADEQIRLHASLDYVIETQGLSVSHMRGFLKDRLPDYMVPWTFVLLDALPLAPSGKLDRGALPTPAPRRPTDGAAFAPPTTPAEQALAKIWGEVLGIGEIGIDDNFFELGGHSLLATQVIARARAALDKQVPVRTLFEQPTIRTFAAAMGAAAPPAAKAPTIGRASRQLRTVNVSAQGAIIPSDDLNKKD